MSGEICSIFSLSRTSTLASAACELKLRTEDLLPNSAAALPAAAAPRNSRRRIGFIGWLLDFFVKVWVSVLLWLRAFAPSGVGLRRIRERRPACVPAFDSRAPTDTASRNF